MALIKTFAEKPLDREARHTEVDATWCIGGHGHEKFLQIDTHGSSKRQIPGKISQSIRLDAHAAAQLRALIDRAFPAKPDPKRGARASSRV